MSKQHIEHLIQEQTATIERLQRQMATHETIRLVLKDLNKHAIMEDQALALLQHEAEHIQDRKRADLSHQVITQLHQIKTASASHWRTFCTPDAQKQGIL